MESIGPDLKNTPRTPLHAEHVEALRACGEERTFAAGAPVWAAGQRMTHFYYLLDGEIEALTPEGERYAGVSLGPGQFVGEISFLHGGSSVLEIRAVSETRVISVPRDALLDLMGRVPEMSDIIMTVFAGRRRGLLDRQTSNLTVIGADVDPAVQRVAAFLSRNRIPYRSLDLEDPTAEKILEACPIPRAPAVLFHGTTPIENPTPRAVARLLGLELTVDTQCGYDVVIVGGGPAGVAAAVYAGAEGLRALVVEDLTIGGQAGTSSRIENYMGFPTGISGADLCWRGEVQALKFGTRFAMPRRVTAVSRMEDGRFCLTLDGSEDVAARAVVVATGVQYRRLPLDRLEAFESRGVYYAATDLEARYCRRHEVVVVGGGNSAGQAAMFLSRTAKHVHVLVRGEGLAASMSSYLSSRLEADPRITIHYGTELEALRGDTRLDGVDVKRRATQTVTRLPAHGVFIMIGAAPNTGWLNDLVALDAKGFVRTGPEVGGRFTYETSVPGVFAVGDVRAGSTKRVASGVGEGSVVISSVWAHINAEA
ncbi:MAG: FAD-dependent oxidoreductase [Myxococcota bacterium]